MEKSMKRAYQFQTIQQFHEAKRTKRRLIHLFMLLSLAAWQVFVSINQISVNRDRRKQLELLERQVHQLGHPGDDSVFSGNTMLRLDEKWYGR
jgi:hypothetical protein